MPLEKPLIKHDRLRFMEAMPHFLAENTELTRLIK